MTTNGVTASPLKTSLRGVFEQAHENYDAMKVRFNDVKLAAKFTGGSLIQKASLAIKAHPFKAVVASFAVGYIAMRWVRR